MSIGEVLEKLCRLAENAIQWQRLANGVEKKLLERIAEVTPHAHTLDDLCVLAEVRHTPENIPSPALVVRAVLLYLKNKFPKGVKVV